jgi:hypothetical protein
MLVVVAVILLVGVENLIAQEGRDRPEAEPKQKGQVEQLRRPRAGEGTGRARVGGMQQRHRLMAVREVEPNRVRALQQKPQRPGQEGSGRLLDELTKAYRENDREKMGQLIRKMNQFRQRMQKARSALSKAGPGVRGRPGAAQPGAKKEHPEIRKAPPKDTDRPGPSMEHRGMMGRHGQGMQGRGMMMQHRSMMGRHGQGMQGRGMMMQHRSMMDKRGQGMRGRGMMGRRGQGMRGRGMMGRRGQGMQGRGMGGWGRGLQGRGRGMGGFGRGFQGRGMGGWGQGAPGPEMD